MTDGKEQPVRQFTLDDIYAFIVEQTGMRRSQLNPDFSLRDDLRVEGDDFSELAESFSKQFNVDMVGYRWYFHHEDEASLNIGGLFFAPPYKRVKSIPVTPQLLLQAANSGSWPIQYPPHTLPSRRYDIVINWILFLPVWVMLAYIGIKKLLTFFSSL